MWSQSEQTFPTRKSQGRRFVLSVEQFGPEVASGAKVQSYKGSQGYTRQLLTQAEEIGWLRPLCELHRLRAPAQIQLQRRSSLILKKNWNTLAQVNQKSGPSSEG